MKKYFIFFIPFLVFFFKSVSLASEVAPNGETYNYHYSYVAVYSWNNQRVTADIWTDGKWASFGSDSGGMIYVCPDETFVIPTTGALNYSGANYYKNGDPNIDSYYRNYVSFGGTVGNQTYYGTASPIVTSNIENFSTRQEAEAYLLEQDIDYNNPYYDPFMKIPEYEVKYNMVDTGDTAPMPLIVGLKNADSDLFVEAVCVNYMPSVVLVEWQNYKAVFSRKFEQHNLIPHESQILSTDVSSDYIGNAISVAWLQDVTSFPVSEVSFSNGIGNDATSLRAYNNMVDLYDTGRQIGCFYGNNTEIYIRYFRIDELGRFVVSSWRTWSSQYSDSFGVELPSYYKTLETASGYENTSSDTSIIISPTTSPDNVNPSNQTGEKKGSPITINIGQNVPNYPDYPTIASYNLDNLLVSAIDNIKGLSSFFSGFVGFCTATFAWIPVQIWQIIAIGFALSIVVMFLKIL